MQTCSKCFTQSEDHVRVCPICQSDLSEFSTIKVGLQKILKNKRVKAVRISVSKDSCPACQQMQGVYSKDQVPSLPVHGCSHDHGCRCNYEPILEEIYP